MKNRFLIDELSELKLQIEKAMGTRISSARLEIPENFTIPYSEILSVIYKSHGDEDNYGIDIDITLQKSMVVDAYELSFSYSYGDGRMLCHYERKIEPESLNDKYVQEIIEKEIVPVMRDTRQRLMNALSCFPAYLQ